MIPVIGEYVDIHTHGGKIEGVFGVRSCFVDEYPDRIKDTLYSVGIHPWHACGWKAAFDQLSVMVQRDDVVAVGECGLDRVCGVNMDIQKVCFEQQILLSQQIGKPLIVHCVRAYSDLLQVLKRMQVRVPVVIHGFDATEEMLVQLMRFNVMFSVGDRLLGKHTKIRKVLPLIPLESLFFESDDKEGSVQAVYDEACEVLGMSCDDLKKKILDNYKNNF